MPEQFFISVNKKGQKGVIKKGVKAAYLNVVSKGEPEGIERFYCVSVRACPEDLYSLKNLSSVLGGDSFEEWVKENFHHLLCVDEIPEVRDLAVSPESIMAYACDYFQINEEQLAVSKRGTENLLRDVAIFLVRRHGRDTLASVGGHFGIGKYSTVSSVVQRIQSRLNQDPVLCKHLAMIETELSKSQRQT